MSSPTISGALRLAAEKLSDAGVDASEAALEARMLYQRAAGWSTSELIGRLTESATHQTLTKFEGLLNQRVKRKPLAYILGEKEFFGRTFQIDERALVPRPETEMIVEHGIRFLHEKRIARPRICDIGTGSGALAITFALEIPECKVVATDVSADCLELARENAEKLGVPTGQIRFTITDARTGEWGEPLGRFDIVVSNPPYIVSSKIGSLEPEVREWEPRLALDGGEDGVSVLAPLIESLPSLLENERASRALIEIDPPVSRVCEVMARGAFKDAEVAVIPDLAGLDRVLSIEI